MHSLIVIVAPGQISFFFSKIYKPLVFLDQSFLYFLSQNHILLLFFYPGIWLAEVGLSVQSELGLSFYFVALAFCFSFLLYLDLGQRCECLHLFLFFFTHKLFYKSNCHNKFLETHLIHSLMCKLIFFTPDLSKVVLVSLAVSMIWIATHCRGLIQSVLQHLAECLSEFTFAFNLCWVFIVWF